MRARLTQVVAVLVVLELSPMHQSQPQLTVSLLAQVAVAGLQTAQHAQTEATARHLATHHQVVAEAATLLMARLQPMVLLAVQAAAVHVTKDATLEVVIQVDIRLLKVMLVALALKHQTTQVLAAVALDQRAKMEMRQALAVTVEQELQPRSRVAQQLAWVNFRAAATILLVAALVTQLVLAAQVALAAAVPVLVLRAK